jgi:hypothetical protein
MRLVSGLLCTSSAPGVISERYVLQLATLQALEDMCVPVGAQLCQQSFVPSVFSLEERLGANACPRNLLIICCSTGQKTNVYF